MASKSNVISFDPGKINKKTGLYEGVKSTQIKQFVRTKIHNDKMLGKLSGVVQWEKDLKKLDKWTSRQDNYGNKKIREYFLKMPTKMDTQIFKQSTDRKTFQVEIQRIKSNDLTKKIRAENLRNLEINAPVKKLLNKNKTLKKIAYSKAKTRKPGTNITDKLEDYLNGNYNIFNDIIENMGGLAQALEKYANDVDRAGERYGIDLKTYAAVFD